MSEKSVCNPSNLRAMSERSVYNLSNMLVIESNEFSTVNHLLAVVSAVFNGVNGYLGNSMPQYTTQNTMSSTLKTPKVKTTFPWIWNHSFTASVSAESLEGIFGFVFR